MKRTYYRVNNNFLQNQDSLFIFTSLKSKISDKNVFVAGVAEPAYPAYRQAGGRQVGRRGYVFCICNFEQEKKLYLCWTFE